jgi:hypothetical protein
VGAVVLVQHSPVLRKRKLAELGSHRISPKCRVEVWIRSDGGAKGAKTRRVQITPKVAPAMQR